MLRFREKSAILKSQFKASDSDVDRSEQDILQEMKEVFQTAKALKIQRIR